MYQVELTYGKSSAYCADGGTTLASAIAHMSEMMRYYEDLGYAIHSAEVVDQCPDCVRGMVLSCRAPRRHWQGFHVERCYTRCVACKGEYRRVAA